MGHAADSSFLLEGVFVFRLGFSYDLVAAESGAERGEIRLA